MMLKARGFALPLALGAVVTRAGPRMEAGTLVISLSAVVFILAGCAGFSGAPKPIISSDTVIAANTKYLGPDAIEKFNSPQDSDRSGLTRRQWRDTVIAAYLNVIDLRYNDFRRELNEETVSVNLGVELIALALTGAGTVASTGAAHALSAAAIGIIGAGAAFNRDVYYQKTLPALFAAMDTNRKQILIQLRTSQQLDENSYSLGAALSDLRAYEVAGSIEGAIAQLTSIASQASAGADAQLHALFTAVVVESSVQSRKVAINQYVRDLLSQNNRAKLDFIARALGLPIETDIRGESYNIRVEMDRRVVDKPSMDALSALLKPITLRDF